MSAATLPDIVCRRGDDGTAVVEGIRQAWVWHSPTGFEWGYRGSGPADLALNILLAATADRDFTVRHHQSFKWRFVASLPIAGGVIRGSDVMDWITPRQTAGLRPIQ